MLVRSISARDWRERHSAAQILLDRALGKPPQRIEGEGALTLSIMHLIAARAITAEVMGSGITEPNAEPPPPVLNLTNAEVLERLGPALE
jgi:hypothetical protein